MEPLPYYPITAIDFKMQFTVAFHACLFSSPFLFLKMWILEMPWMEKRKEAPMEKRLKDVSELFSQTGGHSRELFFFYA